MVRRLSRVVPHVQFYCFLVSNFRIVNVSSELTLVAILKLNEAMQ